MNLNSPHEKRSANLTNKQLLENVDHVIKWIVPPEEVPEREKAMKEFIGSIIESSSRFRENYSRGFQENSKVLDIAIHLKPIKIDWIINFIRGIDYGLSDNASNKAKAINLKKPIFIVIALFASTKYYQQYFIERSIPESDTIEIQLNEFIKESVKTRDAVENLARQRNIVLFDRHQIKRLKLDYLIEQEEFIQDFNNKKPDEDNPHPRIFKNKKAYNLFTSLKESVRLGNEIADYCFIYWKMINDEFMHDIKPKEFRNWLFETYSVDLGNHWKQLYRCRTDEKDRLYSSIKQLHKLS